MLFKEGNYVALVKDLKVVTDTDNREMIFSKDMIFEVIDNIEDDIIIMQNHFGVGSFEIEEALELFRQATNEEIDDYLR